MTQRLHLYQHPSTFHFTLAYLLCLEYTMHIKSTEFYYYYVHATYHDIKLCLVRPIHSRAPIVSKQDRGEVRTSFIDVHLPLHDLQNQDRGLAREDEIACVNINWPEEKENERKAPRALQTQTKVDDPKGEINSCSGKENKNPPSK